MFSNKRIQARTWILISILVFLIAGFTTASFSESYELSFLNTLPKVCPLQVITGYLCAFCGMTHAWIYFWHADWVQAEQENALSLLLYFGAPLFMLSLALSSFWSHERTKKASWVAVAVLAVYTLSRNLK